MPVARQTSELKHDMTLLEIQRTSCHFVRNTSSHASCFWDYLDKPGLFHAV